jgi:hypothetical protein
MATRISKLNKYGHCKFAKSCIYKHVNAKCENQDCNSYSCDNRHPRDCCYMVSHGLCKFGELCTLEHGVPVLGTVEHYDYPNQQHSVLLEENNHLRINISKIVMSIEEMSPEIDKVKATVFSLKISMKMFSRAMVTLMILLS